MQCDCTVKLLTVMMRSLQQSTFGPVLVGMVTGSGDHADDVIVTEAATEYAS